MEGLNIDNIMTGDEIENLFVDEEKASVEPEDKSIDTEGKETNKVTEVNPESLFSDTPESVGNEDDNTEIKESTSSDKEGTSSKFYSSIAQALAEEGILPDLDKEAIDKIASPEDFASAIESAITSKFDERQKRVDAALNLGIEASEVQKYEGTINYLSSVKEDDITAEGEKGESLRRQLIYQDFLNRNYSKERAEREVQKSLNAGTDIEDAKEALKSNIEHFESKYDQLIKDAKQEEDKFLAKRKEEAESLKKSILEDDKLFGDIKVDKTTRQKIFDNISKPIYKNESGELFTAIQKYEMENRNDFMKNLGLIFTLTNGFQSLDALVKDKVTREVKKGLKTLESTLNNTTRDSDGNLKFVTSVEENPESFIKKGWDLDV